MEGAITGLEVSMSGIEGYLNHIESVFEEDK